MHKRNYPPPRPFSRRDLQLEVSWAFVAFAVAFMVVGLLAGCVASPPEEAHSYTVPDHLVLSPVAELAADTAEWAARWSAASGVPVTIGEGGVPVTLVAQLESGADTDLCGKTELAYITAEGPSRWEVRSIRVAINGPIGCAPFGYVIGHELAHALGGPLATHTTYGYAEVFAARLGPDERYRIGEATLDSVCGSGACSAYAPEP